MIEGPLQKINPTDLHIYLFRTKSVETIGMTAV